MKDRLAVFKAKISIVCLYPKNAEVLVGQEYNIHQTGG